MFSSKIKSLKDGAY